MISIKTEKEIMLMRKSGSILGQILRDIAGYVKPGVTTMELEIEIRKMLAKNKVRSPFRGYSGYPADSCISVNDELVHGIPSRRVLNEGDIVSIDLGVMYKGYITDAARTYPVGKISDETKRLIEVTHEAFLKGVAMAKSGNHLYDISFALMNTVEAAGYSVVRDFVSHGVGRKLHEEPSFQNVGQPGTGPELKQGMTLAIEPMVNQGGFEVKVLDDDWTAVTVDGKLSAHYENTVLVTDNGPEILTEK